MSIVVVQLDAPFQGGQASQIMGLDESVATALVAEGTAATATFTETSTNNFVAGDALVIGNNAFAIVDTIGSAAGNILKGADFADTAANLVAAIMGTSGGGTTYVAPANTPNVSAVYSTTIVFTALALGAGGNSLVSTYTPFGTAAGSLSAFTGGSGASLFDMGAGRWGADLPAGGYMGQWAGEATETFFEPSAGRRPESVGSGPGERGRSSVGLARDPSGAGRYILTQGRRCDGGFLTTTREGAMLDSLGHSPPRRRQQHMTRSHHAVVALVLHEVGEQGATLGELCIRGGLFPSEGARIVNQLVQAREIERRDGRLYLRPRRRKRAAPGFWARIHGTSFTQAPERRPTNNTGDHVMTLMRKSAFAAQCGVHKSRLSHWLADKKLDGAAIVGVGRTALIDAPIALDQLRLRLDIDRTCAAPV